MSQLLVGASASVAQQCVETIRVITSVPGNYDANEMVAHLNLSSIADNLETATKGLPKSDRYDVMKNSLGLDLFRILTPVLQSSSSSDPVVEWIANLDVTRILNSSFLLDKSVSLSCHQLSLLLYRYSLIINVIIILAHAVQRSE